jgi:hypothetical protein
MRVIRRKRRIAKITGWIYKYNGQYSKGKIHCSCWLCRPAMDKFSGSISNRRKYGRDMQQLKEYRRNYEVDEA